MINKVIGQAPSIQQYGESRVRDVLGARSAYVANWGMNGHLASQPIGTNARYTLSTAHDLKQIFTNNENKPLRIDTYRIEGDIRKTSMAKRLFGIATLDFSRFEPKTFIVSLVSDGQNILAESITRNGKILHNNGFEFNR